MHFNKGEIPPVNGFWSITMYDAQYFFVDNPLNRYNVSSRSQFKTNADGSVDVIYPAQVTREGHGVQLAPCSCGSLHSDPPHVLAEGQSSFHSRRYLENSACEAGTVRQGS